MSSNPSQFPPLVIDTGPIIELFSFNLFDKVTENYDLRICEAIRDESLFFEDQKGQKTPIDLGPWMNKHKVEVVNVPVGQIQAFLNDIDPTYADSLHAGELEALAYFYHSVEECKLVAGDHIVYKALGRMGKKESGLSLEEVLTQIGLNKKHSWQYTKAFRKKYSEEGVLDFIQRSQF